MAHQEEKWNFDQTKEAPTPAKTPGNTGIEQKEGENKQRGGTENRRKQERENSNAVLKSNKVTK
jgi:hypothetical protein